MMRHFFCILTACFGMVTSGFAATEAKPQVGIVNFATCMSDSKYGKQEQNSFEALKKQMASLLEDTEKQLNELAGKFNDAEFMDGLSPEAEMEMKNKFQSLNEEMQRYQSQYYQVMNQANLKIYQNIVGKIQTAAEKVSKDKKLTMVMNKEACFFFMPTLEVTDAVIAEMDKTFDQDPAVKKQTANNETKPGEVKAEAAQAQGKTK